MAEVEVQGGEVVEGFGDGQLVLFEEFQGTAVRLLGVPVLSERLMEGGDFAEGQRFADRVLGFGKGFDGKFTRGGVVALVAAAERFSVELQPELIVTGEADQGKDDRLHDETNRGVVDSIDPSFFRG